MASHSYLQVTSRVEASDGPSDAEEARLLLPVPRHGHALRKHLLLAAFALATLLGLISASAFSKHKRAVTSSGIVELAPIPDLETFGITLSQLTRGKPWSEVRAIYMSVEANTCTSSTAPLCAYYQAYEASRPFVNDAIARSLAAAHMPPLLPLPVALPTSNPLAPSPAPAPPSPSPTPGQVQATLKLQDKFLCSDGITVTLQDISSASCQWHQEPRGRRLTAPAPPAPAPAAASSAVLQPLFHAVSAVESVFRHVTSSKFLHRQWQSDRRLAIRQTPESAGFTAGHIDLVSTEVLGTLWNFVQPPNSHHLVLQSKPLESDAGIPFYLARDGTEVGYVNDLADPKAEVVFSDAGVLGLLPCTEGHIDQHEACRAGPGQCAAVGQQCNCYNEYCMEAASLAEERARCNPVTNGSIYTGRGRCEPVVNSSSDVGLGSIISVN